MWCAKSNVMDAVVFALCDLDAFYVSVEQVFAPGLRGRPVLVLSNNDGCTISRSSEAKALGIRMGQPAHELAEYVRGSGLVMRSANFTLYGDMSRRVMSILRDALPQVEQYSVDESWLNFTGVPDRVAFAQELRERVHRWTGLANCIGLGPTKTVQSCRIAWRSGVLEWSISAMQAIVQLRSRTSRSKMCGESVNARQQSWPAWESLLPRSCATRRQT